MIIETVDVRPFEFSKEVPVWHLKIVIGNAGKIHLSEYVLFGLPIIRGEYLSFKTLSDGEISYLIDGIRTMELRPIPKDKH